MESLLTFCIGCCNNLNYLKLAVHSVRKYSHFNEAPFWIFAENCNDGTDEWLYSNQLKYNLKFIIEHNNEENTKGIGGGMNFLAKQVTTKYILFLHADMFVSKNWDLELVKIFEKYTNDPKQLLSSTPPEPLWVSSQRFQPNCFKENDRPGTSFFSYEHFGYKFDDFDEPFFIDYAEEFSKINPNIEVTKGEGVSGLIRKEDWDYIGGNDPIYAPAYWEDTDLFIRMQLAGYKFIMTTNSVVFHFGSRSDKSNFPTDEIVRSERSKMYEQKGAQNFFKKWGFWPVHNEYQFVTYPSNIDKTKYESIIRIS